MCLQKTNREKPLKVDVCSLLILRRWPSRGRTSRGWGSWVLSPTITSLPTDGLQVHTGHRHGPLQCRLATGMHSHKLQLNNTQMSTYNYWWQLDFSLGAFHVTQHCLIGSGLRPLCAWRRTPHRISWAEEVVPVRDWPGSSTHLPVWCWCWPLGAGGRCSGDRLSAVRSVDGRGPASAPHLSPRGQGLAEIREAEGFCASLIGLQGTSVSINSAHSQLYLLRWYL